MLRLRTSQRLLRRISFCQQQQQHSTASNTVEASSSETEFPIDPLKKRDLTPVEVVGELDKYVIGQSDAKKAVAIALRERWRRQQLSSELQHEVFPSNILMLGPTGSGKTETARRLSSLVGAPFVKVEATRYTEVGVYGTDTNQMICDLVEESIRLQKKKKLNEASVDLSHRVNERLLNAIMNEEISREYHRNTIETMLKEGELENEIIEVGDTSEADDSVDPFTKLFGGGKNRGFPKVSVTQVPDIDALFSGRKGSRKSRKRRMKVKDAIPVIRKCEEAKVTRSESLMADVIKDVEENGIVFLDEIDKLIHPPDSTTSSSLKGEGVQKELLPLIEGTTVRTPHGNVKTDHILFIAAGAFHKTKPADLLPELQGRLPIRVELQALSQQDFFRILTETKHNLPQQYAALMRTEGVTITFQEDGLHEIASVCYELNQTVQNIGARRLRTVMSKVVEDVSFKAPGMKGEKVVVDKEFVQSSIKSLLKKSDLSRFVL